MKISDGTGITSYSTVEFEREDQNLTVRLSTPEKKMLSSLIRAKSTFDLHNADGSRIIAERTALGIHVTVHTSTGILGFEIHELEFHRVADQIEQ